MPSRVASVAVDAERLAGSWCGVLEPRTDEDRIHLHLRADGTTTQEELDRLLAPGARRVDVGPPPDATWTVLADPEGDESCPLSRTVQEV